MIHDHQQLKADSGTKKAFQQRQYNKDVGRLLANQNSAFNELKLFIKKKVQIKVYNKTKSIYNAIYILKNYNNK